MERVDTKCTEWKRAWLRTSAGALVLLACESVRAESMTAESFKPSYYLFEPVVVVVTLHLDQPWEGWAGDPAHAAYQQRKLSRRLYLNLLQGEKVLTRTLLTGPGFVAERGAKAVRATLITCLGSKRFAVPEYEFTFWEGPGQYELSVADLDNGLESNRVPVELLKPVAQGAQAGSVFAAQGLAALLLVVGAEHGEQAIPAFEKLGSEFADTPYGQYAALCLALYRLERDQVTRRGDSPTGEVAVWAQHLERAMGPFPAGHLLRSRALLELARLRCRPTVGGDPERTLAQLLGETQDGYFAREAEQLLRQLTRTGQNEPAASSD